MCFSYSSSSNTYQPKLFIYPAAATRVYPNELASLIAAFLANLPATRVRSWLAAGQLEAVRVELENCGTWEVDDLRDIACVLLSPREELGKAFELSHIDFRLPRDARQQRLEQLKELILCKLG